MALEPITMHTEFLETTTLYPMDEGIGVYAKHKYRHWNRRRLYRIAHGGVAE